MLRIIRSSVSVKAKSFILDIVTMVDEHLPMLIKYFLLSGLQYVALLEEPCVLLPDIQ